MDLLKRDLAPILPEAWEEIDQEARRVLSINLAGRKLVDFDGPHGWHYAAVNTGRLDMLETEIEGVPAGLRRVRPLLELRVPFTLSILEMDLVSRGAKDPNLDPVADAASRIAKAEDSAIFNGLAAGHIRGIVEESPHATCKIAEVGDYPRAILDARETLRKAGVDGPYALALGTDPYERLFSALKDGYPIVKQIERQIIDGPIVHAPSLRGGVVLSTRGGDFELTVGQDLSIGYAHHDRDNVELYITETFSFRVLEPAAAIGLQV